MLVTVRFIYAKLPDIVCIEYNNTYYYVKESQMHKTFEHGCYKIHTDYLKDGSAIFSYA